MASKFIEMSSELPFLLVDETASIREVLSQYLKKMGYHKVFQAVDGLGALRVLRSEEIGFIICERNLRHMSGMELLKEIRETTDFSRVPFMMLSNDIPKEDVVLASEFGVDGYLKKPFAIKDVSERISASMVRYLDPNNPELIFDEAREATLRGDYENAIARYNAVLTVLPNSARVKVGVGRCYRIQEQLDQAEQYLLEAIRINSMYVHAHHDLGLVYLQKDNIELALKYFDNAISLSPGNPIRYEAVADILIRKAKWFEAENYLMRAVKLELAYPQLYAQLGKVLFAQRKIDRAHQYFEKALKEQPENTSFLNSLGICLKEKKRYDEAINYYNIALKLKPSDIKILFNKALCLITMQQWERAEKTLQSILKVDPDYVKASAKLAELPKLRAVAPPPTPKR